jgi:type II secretory pathway component PulJ
MKQSMECMVALSYLAIILLAHFVVLTSTSSSAEVGTITASVR